MEVTVNRGSTVIPLISPNPLSANFTKWSNTLKQFVCNLPTNCLSVFGHFVALTLKVLILGACRITVFSVALLNQARKIDERNTCNFF